MPPLESSKRICWFAFQNDRLLITQSGNNDHLLHSPLVDNIKTAFTRVYRLTTYQDCDIYCAELSQDIAIPDGLEAVPLKKALEVIGENWYTIAVKAYMIINWDKNHRFCGRCGEITTHKENTFERICPTCTLVFYPRISPSVIVCITHEDKILMARGHHFTPGAYGLIAGFVEPGESVEETVHREVMEETSLKITDLTYYGSQAWPFPDSLMVGFTARYLSGTLDIDPTEIEAAGWYRYDNLPGRPSSSVSISGKLLDYGIKLLQTKYD